MIDRIAGLGGRLRRRRDPVAQPRRLSRRERELRQRRLLYAGIALVTALLLLLLGGGALYEFVIRPRQVLATVNGQEIRRGDYWKVRRYSLISQIQQYQFFAAQNPQYAQFIQQLQQDLRGYKDAPVDPTTLNQMIDDVVLQQRMGELGVSLTPEEVRAYAVESLAPVPVNSPTPSPTVNPTAAFWSSLTATARAVSPTAPATPGTPDRPAAPGTPGPATPDIASTPATPAAAATPTTPATPGTPRATPEPSATPNREEALATATATYGEYLGVLEDEAGMSREDYLRLVARPQLARQRVQDRLTGDIRDVQPQVHAAHILLATRDGAEAARAAVVGGRDFAEVAREQSTDTATAPNGGDLGWFPRGVMVNAFEEAAFALPVGEISQPVQTRFGWHIIKVLERDDARPLTEETLRSLREGAVQKWLDAQRESSTITTILPATPTPAREQFEPPPSAPPTPAPPPPPTPSPGSPPAPAAPTPTGAP